MLKQSAKQLARREKFKNQVRLGDPNVPDYSTGRPSHFMIANGASSDPDLKSVAGSPQFKTPQWQRTVKHG